MLLYDLSKIKINEKNYKKKKKIIKKYYFI